MLMWKKRLDDYLKNKIKKFTGELSLVDLLCSFFFQTKKENNIFEKGYIKKDLLV